MKTILALLGRLNPLGPGFRKIMTDCFTSWNGEWDPSRLFGYGFAILASFQFLIQSAIDQFKSAHWDPVNYSIAAVALGGMYTAVAAGVRVKAPTENPAGTPDNPVTPGGQ
jgi:hypothetical protein